MPVLQPMPRKSLVKGAALARRLNAAATPAIAGTALYPELTESVVERTDDQGGTYYLVASECAERRYYGVRLIEGKWITSTDTERLAKKLIGKVEQYIQEREAAQVASQPKEDPMSETNILFYAQDHLGLYATVTSASGSGTYHVRICAKWLYSKSCDCRAGAHQRDCSHRIQVDQALSEVRPTFSQQCAGGVASRETVHKLLAGGMPGKRAA